MSIADAIVSIDSILDEFLVNVTASTPGHISNLCSESGIFENRKACLEFISICIFSSAVNKKALTDALMKEKFGNVRPFINSKFTVNGAVNMTALNLAGHCFLTKSAAKRTKFGKAWAVKLGQDNLWSGSLDAGQMSDLQRKILKEKAAKIPKDEANKFANEFFSQAGLVTEGSALGGKS
jgi:hypothetical protein